MLIECPQLDAAATTLLQDMNRKRHVTLKDLDKADVDIKDPPPKKHKKERVASFEECELCCHSISGNVSSDGHPCDHQRHWWDQLGSYQST
jgi:hypothetical protein